MSFCSVKWWKMISSPLISALERDEEFLAGVLRATENDPHLRLDQLEVVPSGLTSRDSIDSVTKVHVRGRKGKHLKNFYKALVLKRHPEQGPRAGGRSRDPAWSNEARMYSVVLPVLRRSAGDPTMAARLLPVPACLHVSASVLVLEDLAAHGFSSGNPLKGLDLDHSAAALQALGRFHAVSLSLKHQDRSAFDHLLSQVQEIVFVPEGAPVFGASLESALELAISNLKQCPEQVIMGAVQILQSLQGRTFRTLMSLVAPKGPLSLICHGDFWINNVMFSYKNSKTSGVALTDFQVIRYSSLATDILHFLYTSCEPGLSRDYSDDLIKVYHTSLSETMAKIAPTAPKITLEEVLDEIESHALYGLLMSFLVLPNLANSAKDIEDSSHFCCNRFSFAYSQRIKDIVLEFVEKGFI